jgi:hypothetical protein
MPRRDLSASFSIALSRNDASSSMLRWFDLVDIS